MRRVGHAWHVVVLTLLVGCSDADRRTDATDQPQLPDSATAVRAALDSLRRAGARDLVVDSVARRGDTLTVWLGPPNLMVTDRPATGVSMVPPARIVAIRLVPGG